MMQRKKKPKEVIMLKLLILGLLFISPIYSYGQEPMELKNLSVEWGKKIREADRRVDDALRKYRKATEQLKEAQQYLYSELRREKNRKKSEFPFTGRSESLRRAEKKEADASKRYKEAIEEIKRASQNLYMLAKKEFQDRRDLIYTTLGYKIKNWNFYLDSSKKIKNSK